mmetsp:Transcript_27825/g.38683  ORF Transcript_27825/g.38683 Transcript_27825/m.38683 type:complete len:406 (-) Transcript_27825:265-1482(-)
MHRLFILANYSKDKSNRVDVVGGVHVAVEGGIAADSVSKHLRRGNAPAGNLIPWTLYKQSCRPSALSSYGYRIVRIAINRTAQGRGLGTMMMRNLTSYLSSAPLDVAERHHDLHHDRNINPHHPHHHHHHHHHDDNGRVREVLSAPLRVSNEGEKDEKQKGSGASREVQWIGVAFGATDRLVRFWTRLGYRTVYIGQNAVRATGEHTVVMVRAVGISSSSATESSSSATSASAIARGITYSSPKFDAELRGGELDPHSWITRTILEYQKRMCGLLSFNLRELSPFLALKLLGNPCEPPSTSPEAWTKLGISARDWERVALYRKGMLDYHAILDVVPQMSQSHFCSKLTSRHFSATEQALLIALGLQRKSVEIVAQQLNKDVPWVLRNLQSALGKIMRQASVTSSP